MSKSEVNIVDFEALYNIFFELKEFLKFKVVNFNNEKELLNEINKKNNNENFIIITKNTLTSEDADKKKIILLDRLPINFFMLIDKININLLKQKYNFQSNININGYNLNFNSRTISKNNTELKLTEKEIEIILFLKEQKIPQNIDKLQKEVLDLYHQAERQRARLRNGFPSNKPLDEKKDPANKGLACCQKSIRFLKILINFKKKYGVMLKI